MIAWLISTAVLLLVIAGLIIERAMSGYLTRRDIRDLRKSQEQSFANLASVQKELFNALRVSYAVAARMSKFAIDEMKITNEKLGIPQTPAKSENIEDEPQSKLWPNIITPRDPE